MTVRFSGYPWPSITWFRSDGSEILPISNGKFNVTTTDTSSTLKILSPRLLDSGVYTVNASNGMTSKSQQFNVTISDVPIVTMSDVFVGANEQAHIICRVQSYPKSIVTWVFTPCSIKPRWPFCDHKNIIQNFKVLLFLNEMHLYMNKLSTSLFALFCRILQFVKAVILWKLYKICTLFQLHLV